MSKFNKVRKNVKDFVDMDYLDKLSPEEREFMTMFTDEYYCGGHNKPNSLHKEAFGNKYDEEVEGKKNIKQQLHGDMNAQNRDVVAIAGCSFNILDINLFTDVLSRVEDLSIENQLVTTSPEIILSGLIKDFTDDFKIIGKNTEEGLKTFAYNVVKLYILTKKEDKRQKQMKK
jgi:hypothetical protein